jgi:aminopeptidase
MPENTNGRSPAERGAATLLSTCLGLAREDRFMLVYDETTLRFPRLFESAAALLGVEYVGRFVSRAEQVSRTVFNGGDFLRQMDGVEGILLAVTADPEADGFRIEMADQYRGSATVASMPGASVELLATALDADYDEVKAMCRHLTLPLLKGNDCLITSYDRRGRAYELRLQLGGLHRMPVQSLGVILPRGGWGNPCPGETFLAPLEESADGEYLVNGAVGPQRVLRAREALLTFSAGRLVQHRHLESDQPVAHLDKLAIIARDHQVVDTWNVLAELGIGVNRAIRRIVGVEVIDEKKYGTVHIAVGHNETFGGTNICHPIHCDITTQNPTVTIDGHAIIDRGRHVEDVSAFLEDHRTWEVPVDRRRWLAAADVWPLRDHFELVADQLRVIRRTPSGRLTVYRPFVSASERLAVAFLSALSPGTISMPEDRETFCRDQSLNAVEFERLLDLLEIHRVIAVQV